MTAVIGVGSWDRSGSSIVARIIGSADGVVSVGEINNLWERGVVADLPCGCGNRFSNCRFWGEVMPRAFSGTEGQAILESAMAFASQASNQQLLRGRLTNRKNPGYQAYVSALRRIYEAIAAASGADLIVDSSKIPWHLDAASEAADRFHLVHLIRDPRGVVYSQKKVLKYQPDDDRLMDRHGVGFTTTGWIYRNLLFSALWRSTDTRIIVSYEQFSRNPQSVVEDILRFSGHPPEGLPFTDRSTIALPTEHSVSGNPVRFHTGSIEVDLDDEWKTRLEKPTQYLVGTVTAPLRLSYEKRAISESTTAGTI